MILAVAIVAAIFAVIYSGVKSTCILYLSKSSNTALQKYSVTSKSPEFTMYLIKSPKVYLSTKTKSTKYLKIADLQAHNASHRDTL